MLQQIKKSEFETFARIFAAASKNINQPVISKKTCLLNQTGAVYAKMCSCVAGWNMMLIARMKEIHVVTPLSHQLTGRYINKALTETLYSRITLYLSVCDMCAVIRFHRWHGVR